MKKKPDLIAGGAILSFLSGVLCLWLWLPFGPPDLVSASAGTPTIAAILVSTPAAPPAAPTATLPPAARLSAPATAYGAPDGAIIGPIEAGRPYRVLARSGGGWAQIDAVGSGVVWVRADATLDLASAPDLATPIPPPTSPPPPPAPIVVVQYQEAPAPAPAAPEPAQPPPAPDPPTPAVALGSKPEARSAMGDAGHGSKIDVSAHRDETQLHGGALLRQTAVRP